MFWSLLLAATAAAALAVLTPASAAANQSPATALGGLFGLTVEHQREVLDLLPNLSRLAAAPCAASTWRSSCYLGP